MITKIQKIWMWIFVAMFALPEILWSPVANFLYILSRGGNVPIILRDSFLMHSDYRKLLIIVVALQSLGSLLSLFLIYKSSIKTIYKVLLSILFFVFFILASSILYLLIATASMSPL